MFKVGINPHWGREVDLMAAGEKHLALFMRPTPYLVCHQGYEHLIRMWKRACDMKHKGLISDQSAHIRCGLLLGYKKDDIRSFLKREERFAWQ